jgi:ATP-binding cassette subfamily C exporter for protease/lipase
MATTPSYASSGRELPAAQGASAAAPAAAAKAAQNILRRTAPWRASWSTSPMIKVMVQFRRELWAVGIFSLVVNLLLLTPSIYMMQVYDRVMISMSGFTLVALSAIALFFYGVMTFADWVRSRLLVRAGLRFDLQLNSRVFRASFDRSMNNRLVNTTEALNDLTMLRQFVTGQGVFAFFDLPWIPIYLGVTWLLHPMLAAIAVVFVLVFGVVAWMGHKLTHEANELNMDVRRDVSAFLTTKLRNAEVIESMGLREGIRRRWLVEHEAEMSAQERANARNEWVQAVTKAMQQSQGSLMLGAAAFLVVVGELSPGAMIAANVLMARAVAPMQMMAGTWRMSMAAWDSFKRLDALLLDHPELQLKPLPHALKGTVELLDVGATAPNRAQPILSGINARIEPGEVLVMLGPSGSGKSTLARCMIGIWPQVQGQVRIDGLDVLGLDRTDLGPHIGYIPQDVELFEGTVAENIARFGPVNAEAVIEAARMAGVHDMVLRLERGYDTPMAPGASNLSGGQRQRLALARALYGRPALLVLDEPNANLDDEGERALQTAVLALKRVGSTVVIISHRPGVIEAADKLLILNNGRLQGFGPRDEILQRFARPTAAPHP